MAIRRRARSEAEAAAVAVIRRALELDASNSGELDRISDPQLAEIAESLDISPVSFGRALAESKAGAKTKVGLLGRVFDRIFGPRMVIAERQADGPAAELSGRSIEWLSVTHGLRPRLLEENVVFAEQRRDAVGVVANGIRRAQGLGGLSVAGEIRVAAVDIHDRSEGGFVYLVADLGNRRSDAMAAGVVVVAGGSIVVGVLAVLASPVIWVASPAAVAAGLITARQSHRKIVRRVRSSLDEAADGVARGEAAPKPFGVRRAD